MGDGLTQHSGETNIQDLVKNMELLCDRTDPQDKKFLLFSRLVEASFRNMDNAQRSLSLRLSKTDAKLDEISAKLDSYSLINKDCPVHKNKVAYERFTVFLKYPKITLLCALGVIGLFTSLINAGFLSVLKWLFSV